MVGGRRSVKLVIVVGVSHILGLGVVCKCGRDLESRSVECQEQHR